MISHPPLGRMAALAAAMTMCLAASAHASAYGISASTPNPLAVANAAWPGSPCSGQLKVLFDPAVGQRGHAGEATGIVIFPDGHVERSSCDMTLDPDTWAALTDGERCDVVTHEAGHLAGLRHSATGVMMATVGRWPPCHPRRTPQYEASDFLRSTTLPNHHGKLRWSIRCDKRGVRCVARSMQARMRIYTLTSISGHLSAVLRAA